MGGWPRAGQLLRLGRDWRARRCARCGGSSERAVSPKQALGLALPGKYWAGRGEGQGQRRPTCQPDTPPWHRASVSDLSSWEKSCCCGRALFSPSKARGGWGSMPGTLGLGRGPGQPSCPPDSDSATRRALGASGRAWCPASPLEASQGDGAGLAGSLHSLVQLPLRPS